MIQILLSDLHLTDSPYDEYRWGLFPWLKDKIRDLDPGLKILYILGDLTENKDRHSATLVNRIVSNLTDLYRQTGLHEIVVLRGNHDGLGNVAYFKFLNCFPYIKVITEPQIIRQGFKCVAMLPHTRSPENDWKGIDFSSVHFVMAHITVRGAKSETNFSLAGEKGADELTSLRVRGLSIRPRIFSGDVHVPQQIGTLTYVGAPYPIRFGDSFRGRVLVLGRRGHSEWHFPTIKKAKCGISDVSALGRAWLRKGDQLKVELQLPKGERHEWHKHREEIQAWCERKGVILRGVELQATPTLKIKQRKPSASLSPVEALKTYTRKARVGEKEAKAGERLLEVAQKRGRIASARFSKPRSS